MPELPDLTILAEAFSPALVGRAVVAASVADPLVLRATPDQVRALEGALLRSVRRRGKFLVLAFDRHEVWFAPMLTGRLALVAPTSTRPRPAITLRFGPRSASGAAAPAWAAGATWLPAEATQVDLRYLDPTRMGKVYVVPPGGEGVVPNTGPDDLGPDVDDPAFTIEDWRARIRRHPGELKGLLRNQGFVAGIGNAYADEILWAARLSPWRRRSSLATEEIDLLYETARAVLADSVDVLRSRVAPTFEKQVRDHLKVHLRGGSPCARCGATISQVGGREATSWCRTCQR